MAYDISSKDLSRVWSAPDNSRLMGKQISIRLPVHVAAKLFALEEMYPSKTRTQIVGDLLACALSDMESGMRRIRGRCIDRLPDGEEIYEDVGERPHFLALANKHLRRLEEESGNTEFKEFSIPDILDGEVSEEKE